MTPSKIADPLLPEMIAELRVKWDRVTALASTPGFSFGDALATAQAATRELLPQLLSAAERGIAAGEEVERRKAEHSELVVELTHCVGWQERTKRAEADLAASNARIGEVLQRYVDMGPNNAAVAREIAAELGVALLTPTHPETER